MKFLIDNQLPPALAEHLVKLGYVATHVRELSLDCASDREIWALATRENWVIVSKDDDFRVFANQKRSIPPQVVWVRLRNCRTRHLIAAFDAILEELIIGIKAGESIIELR